MDTSSRFWQKVHKTGKCWEWIAAKLPKGYGIFAYGDGGRLAHRFSWELHNGPIPEGVCVLHHCDNPACVRPSHLFLGTLNDNVMDAVSKRRHSHGETHATAKLGTLQVVEIRRKYHDREQDQYALARMYGVSNQQISKIISGKRWKYVGGPIERSTESLACIS